MKKFLRFGLALLGITVVGYDGAYAMSFLSPIVSPKPTNAPSQMVIVKKLLDTIPEEESEEEKKRSKNFAQALQTAHWAAALCDKALLQKVLESLGNIDTIVDVHNRRTALHRVVGIVVAKPEDQFACMEYLINCGADVNRIDANGETPLFIAASLGNLMCVKYLVSKKAFVDARKCRQAPMTKCVHLVGSYTPLGAAVIFSNRSTLVGTELKKYIDTIVWLIKDGGADYTLDGGYTYLEIMNEWLHTKETPLQMANRKEVREAIEFAIKAREAAKGEKKVVVDKKS